jgi:hypothetical protein
MPRSFIELQKQLEDAVSRLDNASNIIVRREVLREPRVLLAEADRILERPRRLRSKHSG